LITSALSKLAQAIEPYSRWLFVLYTLLVFYLLTKENETNESLISIPHLDKAVHAMIFFGWTFLLKVVLKKPSVGRIYWLMICLACITETLQIWTKTRQFSLLDICADLFGVLILTFLKIKIKK